MLDKTIPYAPVIMDKHDPENYPRYILPSGFSFQRYQDGFERDWGRIHYELGQTETLEEGISLFHKEFLDRPQDARQRCFFVADPAGRIVATTSLWYGDAFGREDQRIHWVAVAPGYQGKGLAKALLTRAFDLYHELGYSGYIYLVSQTWSYKALHLYQRFGFHPYKGPKPQNWESDNFAEENNKAWQLIEEKLKTLRSSS